MGRKSSAKSQTPPSAPPTEPKRSFTALLIIASLAVVLIGGFIYWRSGQSAPDVAQAATPVVTEVPELLKKPHPQKDLPPLQFPNYPMGRPVEVVRAAYQFAAEH